MALKFPDTIDATFDGPLLDSSRVGFRSAEGAEVTIEAFLRTFAGNTLKMSVVEDPSTVTDPSTSTIYLKPIKVDGVVSYYEQYIYDTSVSNFVFVGKSDISMTDYVAKSAFKTSATAANGEAYIDSDGYVKVNVTGGGEGGSTVSIRFGRDNILRLVIDGEEQPQQFASTAYVRDQVEVAKSAAETAAIKATSAEDAALRAQAAAEAAGGQKVITTATINADGDLVVAYSDNTSSNLGHVVGANGETYVPGSEVSQDMKLVFSTQSGENVVVDVSRLQGVPGERGERGPAGPTGPVGPQGDSVTIVEDRSVHTGDLPDFSHYRYQLTVSGRTYTSPDLMAPVNEVLAALDTIMDGNY